MSAAAFFKEYIRNRKTIGAVAPSSPALACRIAEAAGVWEARHVLELGPGTGALTAAIADSKAGISGRGHKTGLYRPKKERSTRLDQNEKETGPELCVYEHL